MGAIYRVAYEPRNRPNEPSAASESHAHCLDKAVAQKLLTEEEASTLVSIVNAPSPWSAWSMATWRSKLSPIGKSHLAGLATGRIPLDGTVDVCEKMILRAAQMLTRIGERPTADTILQCAASPVPAARVSAWWLAGRQSLTPADEAKLQRSMRFAVPNPIEGTCWETHLGSDEVRLCWEAVGLRRWAMGSADGLNVENDPSGVALRRTWLWALSRTNQPPAKKTDRNRYDVLLAKLLFGSPRNGADSAMLDALNGQLSADHESLGQQDQLEILTAMQASLGDRRGAFPLQTDAPADASDGYRGRFTSQLGESARNNWARWALYFASHAEKQGWAVVHAEALRTLAMMEPSDQQCLTYLLNKITPETHPTYDIHILCCMAQCTAPRTPQAANKIAAALADMVRKVKARGLYTDNQWPIRLNQLVTSLLRRDKSLGDTFVELPMPCCNEDLALIQAFPPNIQDAAKEKIRSHLRAAPAQDWSVPIVKFAVLGSVDESLRDAMRRASTLEPLRSICVEFLSKSPQDEEYDLFVSAIESTDPSLWPDAWRGLSALDSRDPGREFPAMAKLVSASLNSSTSLPRPAVLQRVRSVAARALKPVPPASDLWSDWNTYFQANLSQEQLGGLITPRSPIDGSKVLQTIDSLKGDTQRGAVVYQAKCGLCHGGQSALGPSLVGVARRFSREDLARSIYEPSRDVSDRYRAIRVLTVDDEILTGMVIYNAADGVTLQAADGSILRINQDQIQEKAYSTESLMPSGLLEDKSPQDIADLFAYLGTLQ
jgi:putative heme-binding domain-containing protein